MVHRRVKQAQRRLRGMNNNLKTNEQGDINMTQDDNDTRRKKEWARRYKEMLKAGFSEAMARMEADDYVEAME